MTTDATFVEMIGRNLSYFEQMLDQNRNAPVTTLGPFLNDLYRAIDFAAREPCVNRRAGELFVRSWSAIEHGGSYEKWARLAIRIANRFDDGDTFLLCRIVTLVGGLQQDSGDDVKAKQTFRKAEQLAFAKEDTRAVVNAWYYRATYEYKTGDFDSAEKYLIDACNLIETELDLDDADILRLHGFTLNLLGSVARLKQEFTASEAFFNRAFTSFKRLDQGHYHIIAQLNLAALYTSTGEIDRAVALFDEAIGYTKKHQLLMYYSSALRNYSDSLVQLGRYEEALEIGKQEDLQALLQAGHMRQVASGKMSLGHLHILCGKFDEAKPYLNEASIILKQTASDLAFARALGLLGYAHRGMGDEEEADKFFSEAISVFRSVDNLVSYYEDIYKDIVLAMKDKQASLNRPYS